MTSPIGEVVLVFGVYSISIIADLRTSKSLIKGIAQHCIRELINGWEYVRLGDICKITTGKLATAAHKAYDFTVGSKRYQVKARVAKKGKITGSLSDIHHWQFDYLVVVLYNEDGTIKLVKELTEAEAEQLAYKNTGREIISVSSVKRQKVGKDITAAIKSKYGI